MNAFVFLRISLFGHSFWFSCVPCAMRFYNLFTILFMLYILFINVIFGCCFFLKYTIFVVSLFLSINRCALCMTIFLVAKPQSVWSVTSYALNLSTLNILQSFERPRLILCWLNVKPAVIVFSTAFFPALVNFERHFSCKHYIPANHLNALYK